jgi:rSAM/selenodomain-associated transferase 2
MGDAPLSIVIPALDAADSLPMALEALDAATARDLVREVIVVDGGSADRTAEVARRLGARVLTAERGRGPQLFAGAAAARGDWLLFLHADTRLGAQWPDAVQEFIAGASAGGGENAQAAVFRFALDDDDPRARRIERLARWRGRVLGLPYGDQGLLLPRALYRQTGGYRPITLMEDIDLVRRIGRRRLATLDCAAYTSAQRYRKGGWWLRPIRNLMLLTLYYLGMPPGLLARFYG